MDGNVTAGGFVKFVSKEGEWKNNSISENVRSGVTISAVKLSENKVFIAHSYGDSYCLYGIVVEINGTSITVGTNTQLSTVSKSGHAISAVKLSENKVFIAHSNYGTNYYLYGMVVEINGTNITAGTDIELGTTYSPGYAISTVTLNENRVFIVHSYGNTHKLNGMIVEINGNNITAGTDARINTNANSGNYISTILLSNNKIFIVHSYGDNSEYLYGIVVEINETNITTGTDKQLKNVNVHAKQVPLIVLSENKLFIGYGVNYYLYGMVVEISGTSITVSTDVQLSSSTNSGHEISAVKLSENKVFIAHGYGSDYHLYGMIIEINGSTITAGTDMKLSNVFRSAWEISAVLLNENIFIVHSYTANYQLYLTTNISETLVNHLEALTDQIARYSQNSRNRK